MFRRYFSDTAIVTGQRLIKYIANTGVCSRRQAEILIKEGRIQVDGTKIQSVSHILLNEKQIVLLDGARIRKGYLSSPPKLWAIYKNRSELVAEKDSKNRALIIPRAYEKIYGSGVKIDTIEEERRLKPISRLDYTTEGICLISNNGMLARILNDEATGMVREYRIRIHGLINESKLEGLKRGVFMNGKRQKPMPTIVENSSSTISWIRLSTTETSNRKVYESLKQLHLDVTRMICIKFGPYKVEIIGNSGICELKITPDIMKAFLKPK